MDWTLGHLLVIVVALLVGLGAGWWLGGRSARSGAPAAPASAVDGEPSSGSPGDAGAHDASAETPAGPESAEGAGDGVSAADSGALAPAESSAVGTPDLGQVPGGPLDQPTADHAGGPGAGEQHAGGPAAVEPDAAEPLAAEPLAVEPAAAEPLAAEPAVSQTAAPDPVAADPVAVAPAPASAAEAADDLRRVEGIGPKTALALQAAGLRTYAQIAEADEATLRAAVRAAGLRSAPGIALWPQRARVLAGGGPVAAEPDGTPVR